MRKIHILGAALVAMVALSALVVSSASAALVFELALWLLNGADLTVADPVDAVGTLLFHNTSNGGTIDCSGLFEGSVGPSSLDEITMVWDLSTPQRLIEELVGTGLLCEALASCENSTDVEIWPLNLPFLTELEQDSETGKFYDLFVPNANGLLPAYHIKCLVLGFNFEEECSVVSGTEAEVVNVAGGVETVGKASPNSNCGGGTGNGEVESLAGNLESTETGTLSVSLNASKE